MSVIDHCTDASSFFKILIRYYPPAGYHSALVLLALVVLGCEAQDQRQNPQASGVVARPRQQKQQTQQKQAPIGNITCGTLEDLVNRVEVCAAPLMDILQGSIAKWPRTDADIGDLCQSVSSDLLEEKLYVSSILPLTN